jgi:transcriptional regulator with XRE-family HTH domain
MSASQSPTVRRRRLGMELRKRRESASLRIEDVAKALECSMSRVSRIETGRSVARIRDVRDMLELFGVTDEQECELLAAMAREAQQKGWWTTYEGVLPAGLDTYVGFEESAASLRSFQNTLVAGLLQTEEYARALITATGEDSPEQIDNRVRLRMVRHELITHDDPVEFWCVLDEAALLRPVGGRRVMQRQLEYLATMAELPNVRLQVLPLDIGAHAGMDGSFVLLSFPHESDPDTVYVTIATGGVFQEKADELSRYAAVFDRLQEAALPPEESAALVNQMAKEPL